MLDLNPQSAIRNLIKMGVMLMSRPCRRRFSSFFPIALCAFGLAAALLAGCVHPTAPTPTPQAKPLTQAQIDEMIKNQTSGDPFLRSQLAYGLEARLTAPSRIQATVTNKTTQPAVIGPKSFALIIPGPERQMVKPAVQSAKSFPLTKLSPGEQVSGELFFTTATIPAGARLAFFPIDGSQPAQAPVR